MSRYAIKWHVAWVASFDNPMKRRILVVIAFSHYSELTRCRAAIKIQAARFTFQSIDSFLEEILSSLRHETAWSHAIGYRLRHANWDSGHKLLISWLLHHHGHRLLITVLHRLTIHRLLHHHWLAGRHLPRVHLHARLHLVAWGHLLTWHKLLLLLSWVLRRLLFLHNLNILLL